MAVLSQGAANLGICLSGAQLDQFELYYRELADWNRRANLTAISGYEETQVKHFLDSLTAAIPFRESPDLLLTGLPGVNRVVDIGSGAGFPGLPLKLAFPEIELHLIESVGKKTAFLEHVAEILNLTNVTVHTGRSETLARDPELRESFDLALVRGVARLPLLLEYALPFCRPPLSNRAAGAAGEPPDATSGRTLAMKHGGLEAELAQAAFALEELGGVPSGVYRVTEPSLDDGRVVVVFDKVRPTSDRYPRRIGIPAKRPLAPKTARQ